MLNSFFKQFLLKIPTTSSGMEFSNLFGLKRICQLILQEVLEQMVVAKPAAVMIE